MSCAAANSNVWAVVALGANLGNRRQTILRAMDRLESFSEHPLRRSSLWRSLPIDCPPGSPPFVNAVVALRPKAAETPESLLDKLQGLEREMGRTRTGVANEPRVLDLDLIVFGAVTVQSARLTLPHPRAASRRFVLEPLDEILPGYILPGQTRTVRQLLEAQDPDRSLIRLAG